MTARATRRLLVVTNRAPASFAPRAGALRVSRGAGGVVTALRDLARVMPVTWVAVASGEGDLLAAQRQREHGGLLGSGRLALRLVPMAKDLFTDYYGGFANRILWFVQHGMWEKRIEPPSPGAVRELAGRYARADRIVADHVVREMHRPGQAPTAMIHDYQLYLVPQLLRDRVPGALLSHFVHIPWPRRERWSAAVPDDVLELLVRGLLGADIVGFQDVGSAQAFAACADALVREARVSTDEIRLHGRTVLLRVRPVSIEAAELRPRVDRIVELRDDPRRLLVRVDRGDPSKNVASGFAAFERLLERRPDLVGRVRFVARITPSRSSIPEYARERARTHEWVRHLNARFGSETVELHERSDRGRALAELAAADAILVNPLADGMNLVAKEAAVLNDRLALVLSRRAGAHAELAGAALGVDPRDIGETSLALERALEMDEPERRARARSARAAIRLWTARHWLDAELGDLEEARSGRETLVAAG